MSRITHSGRSSEWIETPVALVHPESEKTVGGVEDRLPVLRPGDLLPDPEVLLPHRHQVGPVLGPLPHIGGRCLEADVSRRLARLAPGRSSSRVLLKDDRTISAGIELCRFDQNLTPTSRRSIPNRPASAPSSISVPWS